MHIEPGHVISTVVGEGIVIARAPSPDARWRSAQTDERVRGLPTTAEWWRVFPLRGGAILAAAPLMTVLREATYDDFLVAVDHGNDHARRALAVLFPEFTARARQSVGRENP